MKRMFLFPALVLAASTLAVFSQTQPAAPPAGGQAPDGGAVNQVAGRGADYCVWQESHQRHETTIVQL